MNQDIMDDVYTLAKSVQITKDRHNSRVAAAIVYRNKVLSLGYNHRKSHPMLVEKYRRHKESYYFHAETHAIHIFLKQYDTNLLAKCSMYIARMKFSSDKRDKMMYGLAKPCSGCTRALIDYGIKEVYFTDNDQRVKKLVVG